MVPGKAGDLQLRPKGGPRGELFVSYSSVTRTQLEQFEFLLDKNSSEAELGSFLRDNPCVLVNSLKVLKTGYDGAWVISQQLIRSSMGAIQNGLIPDFTVGGCNPCCFSWFVLEFKGADQQMLSESDNYLHFSSSVNMAIGQRGEPRVLYSLMDAVTPIREVVDRVHAVVPGVPIGELRAGLRQTYEMLHAHGCHLYLLEAGSYGVKVPDYRRMQPAQ